MNIETWKRWADAVTYREYGMFSTDVQSCFEVWLASEGDKTLSGYMPKYGGGEDEKADALFKAFKSAYVGVYSSIEEFGRDVAPMYLTAHGIEVFAPDLLEISGALNYEFIASEAAKENNYIVDLSFRDGRIYVYCAN